MDFGQVSVKYGKDKRTFEKVWKGHCIVGPELCSDHHFISHKDEQLLAGCATRDTTGLRYLDSIVDCNSDMFSQSECQNIYIFYSIHICKLLLLPPSLNIISQLNEKLDIYCGFYIFYYVIYVELRLAFPSLTTKIIQSTPFPKLRSGIYSSWQFLHLYHVPLLFVIFLKPL